MTFIPHLGAQSSEMTTVQVQGESRASGGRGVVGTRVLLRDLVSRGQQPSLSLPLMPGRPQSPEMSTMLSKCPAPAGYIWSSGKEGDALGRRSTLNQPGHSVPETLGQTLPFWGPDAL